MNLSSRSQTKKFYRWAINNLPIIKNPPTECPEHIYNWNAAVHGLHIDFQW